MNGHFLKPVFAGALLVAATLAAPNQAHADNVPEYDGSWKAPDVSVFLGSDVVINSGADKSGTSLNETIFEHWYPGACTYDSDTGEPSNTCDRLRYGLTLYRAEEDDSGACSQLMDIPFWPKEDGGGHLTSDEEIYKIDGKQYKVSSLGGKKQLYCNDTEMRPLGEVMYSYRDERLAMLGTNWPDRPQLHYHLIKNLPQQSTGQNGNQVREALMAACNLFHGNGNQHLSMPSWVMTTPNSDPDADLYAGMLAAAGGTGQCCYRGALDSSCDPQTDAIDMCAHLKETTVDGNMRHNEARLRQDIADARYTCGEGDKVAAPGGIPAESQSEMKCQLQNNTCADDPNSANLWPLFTCMQFRPSTIHPDDLAIHFCSDDLDTVLGTDDYDKYNYRNDDRYDEDCITLSKANGGIEFVDEAENIFYPTIGGTALCGLIGENNGWTQIVCPNQGQLCDLTDGSQCSIGRLECVNEFEQCNRYPGNDSCDSSACAGETVHETGVLPPNAQFVVDRSGSMPIDDRWGTAKQVAMNLADWSYQGAGCDDDGSSCDRVRLGVHFWSGMNPGSGAFEVTAISAAEDTTSTAVGTAFDENEPYGGTDFHHGARLLQNEAALTDPNRTNVGIFVTDGISENAYTSREAARIMCDLRNRGTAPVSTHVVGFADGEENLNSFLAAAGGTGSCCFTDDGVCDTETDQSPCEMYRYEQTNGQNIVDTFESWLQSNRSAHYNEWVALNDRIATDSHTSDSYRTGSVAADLGMVDDVTRWLIKQDEGWDPQHLDCANDGGDSTSTNALEFYKWVLCETQKTLSYPVRHLYGGNIAENVSTWSDFDYVYTLNHDSTFVDHNYVCTGSKYAGDGDALQEELQAILEGIECTYPLTLLADQDSAPSYTDATRVKLYMPEYDAVVRVPHSDDADGMQAFRDEMCALGVPNCDNFVDDSWTFANEGRTAVELSAELCDFTKGESVEKVTTQACRVCDPDRIGTACNWVQCNPTSFSNGYGYDDDGVQCQQVTHPCPNNPDDTCESWAKTGRCGMGEYACDEDGLPICEQVHSRMPEICNGVDDDCDGDIDDLEENREEWSGEQYDISGEEYDGWYCGYHDSCRCPDRQPDSIGGYKTDADEFVSMMKHQQENGECECGEGFSANLEPTRTYTTDESTEEPKAGCSATGSGSAGGFASMVLALLFGVFGLRRRR